MSYPLHEQQLSFWDNAQPALPPANIDLIGRHYYDGASKVRVLAVCAGRAARVIVERELDGKCWAVPAGVMRLLVGDDKQTARRGRAKRLAAA